jgi:hypothetical protein
MVGAGTTAACSAGKTGIDAKGWINAQALKPNATKPRSIRTCYLLFGPVQQSPLPSLSSRCFVIDGEKDL